MKKLIFIAAIFILAQTSPAQYAKPPADPKRIEFLISFAETALTKGDYQIALSAFQDILKIDPKNQIALHGVALTLFNSNDLKNAEPAFEKALAVYPANRAIVINTAAVLIANKNPMRAAKIVKEYLTIHNQDLDEPMVNALAVAMGLASGQARKATLFRDCIPFYTGLNAKLEAVVPGLKRWGIDWLPSNVANMRIGAMNLAQSQADAVGNQLANAQTNVSDAQSALEGAHGQQALSRNLTLISIAENNLAKAMAFRDIVQQRYDIAVAAIQYPDLPKSVPLLGLNDIVPTTLHDKPIVYLPVQLPVQLPESPNPELLVLKSENLRLLQLSESNENQLVEAQRIASRNQTLLTTANNELANAKYRYQQKCEQSNQAAETMQAKIESLSAENMAAHNEKVKVEEALVASESSWRNWVIGDGLVAVVIGIVIGIQFGKTTNVSVQQTRKTYR